MCTHVHEISSEPECERACRTAEVEDTAQKPEEAEISQVTRDQIMKA